jgi:hypothetical protein
VGILCDGRGRYGGDAYTKWCVKNGIKNGTLHNGTLQKGTLQNSKALKKRYTVLNGTLKMEQLQNGAL